MPKSFKNAIRQYLKRYTLRRTGVHVYNNTVLSNTKFLGKAVIEPYCRLVGDPQIIIGDDFYMNAGCHLLGDITIGDHVLIGPKTVIWGRDHGTRSGQLIKVQEHIRNPILIEDDVWIGASATILKGVTISKGAVIGAGSVVTKNVPANAIVVGNPARVLRFREK
jgi:acetyltransferase-like isoleucine patch superfamily enzyme